MATAERALTLKVADAVWVATAMLHREHPRAEGFTVAEIVAKVKAEGLTDKEDLSTYIHANQHCVANRPPNQAKLRMLFETKDGLRRLFCPSDSFHGDRDGRVTPRATDIPESLAPLLRWYQDWCAKRRGRAAEGDPLLELVGTGKGMWGEDAVKYVNRLRTE
jgi:hypothetical protein